MADIYGSHFEYGGISSRKYGLIIATVESERQVLLNGAISGETVFNKKNKRKYLVGDNYSESPLVFEIEIVTDNDRILENKERREIEKWLFNKHDYRKFYLDVADDVKGETVEIIDGAEKRLYLFCRFINPIKLEYNGGIVGYRVTLEADSGWWWQDPISTTIDLNHASANVVSTISLEVDTDIDDYVYPKVTIIMGNEGGNILLTNVTDDLRRVCGFDELPQNSTVIINGEINYVSSSYYNFFTSLNFPRLVDGTNNIVISGNIQTIKFEYSNRRNW